MAKTEHDLAVYRELVPETVRNRLKAEVMGIDPNRGVDGCVHALKYIMAELLAGNITAEVAALAKDYLELYLAAATIQEAKTQRANDPVADQLAAARKKAQAIAAMPRELPDPNSLVDVDVELLEKRRLKVPVPVGDSSAT